MTNIIYLYIHKKTLERYRNQRILSNDQIMYVINTYLKFMPKLIREETLKEMIRENILKRVNRDKVQIMNQNQSVKIDKMFSERMGEMLEEERKKHFWYNRQIPEVEG